MKPISYPDTDAFPYRIKIGNHIDWTSHYDIQKWCKNQFGDDNHCVTWRHALSGSPSRLDPEFSTWLFANEEDAVLFKMVWQDEINNAEQVQRDQNRDSETGS